jgi:hypothetical protein
LKIFDFLVKKYLRQDSKALDVGFDSGFFLYRLYHLHKIHDLSGVEENKNNRLSGTFYMHSPITNENLFYKLERKSSHPFYSTYCNYVKLELKKIPLKKPVFESKIKSNLLFNTTLQSEKLNENEFDFIILSRVLHYIKSDKQIQFINKCISSLKLGGIIFIVIPTDSQNKINKNRFEALLYEFPSLKELYNKRTRKYGFSTYIIYAGIKIS